MNLSFFSWMSTDLIKHLIHSLRNRRNTIAAKLWKFLSDIFLTPGSAIQDLILGLEVFYGSSQVPLLCRFRMLRRLAPSYAQKRSCRLSAASPVARLSCLSSIN